MKKKKTKRIFRLAVTIAVVLLTAGILFWMYLDSRTGIKTGTVAGTAERQYQKITVDGEKYTYNTDLITMLVLGIDAGDSNMVGQSDSISLVIFDRGEERIKIVGISRDAMVPIRVFDAVGNDLGWDIQHLALAYPFGHTKEKGCLLAQEAVSKMFHGIPLIYYGAANLSAIPVFHNVVGEITIQFTEQDLEELSDDLYQGTTLTLTSENAEQFLRERDTTREFSNAGRMKRQMLYIDAYLKKLKLLLEEDFSGTVSRMKAVFSNTVTNLNVNEISSFAEMILKYQFDPEQDYIIVQGTDHAGEYHDEFLVDEEALQQLVLQIFYRKN